MPIAPGVVLDERFRVGALLGEGSAAQVFEGEDLRTGKRVAIKALRSKGVLADPRRFQEEARTLRNLRHPHVLALLAGGSHQGAPWIALAFAEGGSLADALPREGFGEARAAELALQVLDALGAAHRAGILHRDVKPENVLLGAGGEALLSDFGLAKRDASGIRTATGLVLGTPEYMAPEVMEGRPATVASDLYSWGCLLYAMVNGRPPGEGTPAEVARARVKGIVPPGKERGAVAAALRAALRRDPEARPDTSRLRRILTGEEEVPPPSSESATRLVSEDALPAAPAAASARPTPTPLWRSPGVLLGGAALLGAAGMLLGTGGAPAPAPAPTTTALAEDLPHERLAARWMARGEALLPGIHLAELHAAVYPEDVGYPAAMLRARQGESPRGADLAELERRRGALPHREELREDRAALREALLDPALASSTRRALFLALQELAIFDHYYRGWGTAPPYDLEPLLRALVPVEVAAHHKGWYPARPPPPLRPAPPGKHLLFSWAESWDRQFP